MGIVSPQLPLAGFAVNFSPMPRMAPPAFGGVSVGDRYAAVDSSASPAPAGSGPAPPRLAPITARSRG